MGEAREALVPAELKDAGWKLGRQVVNDDEDHPFFYLQNERLAQGTGNCDSVDEAIEAGLVLHFRSINKKVSRKEIQKLVREHTGTAPAPAPFSALRTLLFTAVRRDGGTQPRAGIDQATVDRYADEKKDGAKFEPGIVFWDGQYHWLARGFHRTAADEKNGLKSAEFEIREGTQRDAILFSLGENSDHGRLRTPEDKRRVVMTMLEDPEWKKLSASAIADATKTSQTFVSNIRRALNDDTKASASFKKKLQTAAGGKDLKRFKSETSKVVGRDRRETDTKAIGKRAAAAQTDIRVDITEPRRPAAATNGHGLIPEDVAVIINLTVAAGKSATRKLTIGARAGEGKPLFRTDLTTADLQPMPPALSQVFAALAKRIRPTTATKKAATKKK